MVSYCRIYLILIVLTPIMASASNGNATLLPTNIITPELPKASTMEYKKMMSRLSTLFTLPDSLDPALVRMSVPAITALRKEILAELMADGLIDSAEAEVKLEIQRDRILCNGKELRTDLDRKYRRIAKRYKIGAGPNRQIRIDPEIIEVGDFTENGVRGTWKKEVGN